MSGATTLGVTRRFALLLLLLIAGAASGCISHVRIAGRLAFAESDGCAPSYDGQVVPWSDCHAFKRHFAATTGAPVTANNSVAGTLRPLSVSIDLTYLQIDDAGKVKKQCGRGTYRADRDGYFSAYLPACGGGKTRVVGRPFLRQSSWQIEDGAPFSPGFIRAVWRESEAIELFPGLSSAGIAPGQVHAYETTEEGKKVRYAIPSLGFQFDPGAEPSTDNRTPAVPIGTQVFLSKATDDQYGYLRQVLSAFQTMVELHARLKSQLRADPVKYDRMFAPMTQFENGSPTYLINFGIEWATGGAGGINLYRPHKERFKNAGGLDAKVLNLLSDTGTLAHEFGHSIHHALAASSTTKDDDFGIRMTRADGSDASWGHFPAQLQENGFAFVEGVASSLGQFFLNGCNGAPPALRPQGGSNPFAGVQFSGDASCDATDPCPYRYLRAELRRRGVSDENSDAWKTRIAGLRTLATTAINAGHGNIVYNDEWRWAEFGCDVLDNDADVTHAAATTGASYIADFTQAASEVLDGRSANARTARFPATPALPEDVRVTLPRFITAIAEFCPQCKELPAGPGGADYNRLRLSASGGVQSPQAFGRHLEAMQLITHAQLRNLLRTNFMDDVP